MKKTRFIALTLLVAIALMGAGYAAWQETLTITHSVSTGNVDVRLENGSADVYENIDANKTDGLSRIATVEGADQEATITLTNLYPGAKVVVNIPVKNNSTIPVKYKEVSRNNVPEWLDIVEINCPENLGVQDTENLEIIMVVKDNAEEKINNVIFQIVPVYEQWNAR